MQGVLTLSLGPVILKNSLAGRSRKSDLLRLELRVRNGWLFQQKKLPIEPAGMSKSGSGDFNYILCHC